MSAVFGERSCRRTQERRSQLCIEGYSSSVPWIKDRNENLMDTAALLHEAQKKQLSGLVL